MDLKGSVCLNYESVFIRELSPKIRTAMELRKTIQVVAIWSLNTIDATKSCALDLQGKLVILLLWEQENGNKSS